MKMKNEYRNGNWDKKKKNRISDKSELRFRATMSVKLLKMTLKIKFVNNLSID